MADVRKWLGREKIDSVGESERRWLLLHNGVGAEKSATSVIVAQRMVQCSIEAASASMPVALTYGGVPGIRWNGRR